MMNSHQISSNSGRNCKHTLQNTQTTIKFLTELYLSPQIKTIENHKKIPEIFQQDNLVEQRKINRSSYSLATVLQPSYVQTEKQSLVGTYNNESIITKQYYPMF